MLSFLLILGVLCDPNGWRPCLDKLDSPQFAIRSKADKDLRAGLTWAQAVKLERSQASLGLGPEGRRRLENALADYWRRGLPSWEQMPYIDALNTAKLCESPNVPIVTKYLDKAAAGGATSFELSASIPGVRYPSYRYATSLLVEDLNRAHVPPYLTRQLLAYMQRKSQEYDKSKRPFTPGP